jgi:hypothetical protein
MEAVKRITGCSQCQMYVLDKDLVRLVVKSTPEDQRY